MNGGAFIFPFFLRCLFDRADTRLGPHAASAQHRGQRTHTLHPPRVGHPSPTPRKSPATTEARAAPPLSRRALPRRTTSCCPPRPRPRPSILLPLRPAMQPEGGGPSTSMAVAAHGRKRTAPGEDGGSGGDGVDPSPPTSGACRHFFLNYVAPPNQLQPSSSHIHPCSAQAPTTGRPAAPPGERWARPGGERLKQQQQPAVVVEKTASTRRHARRRTAAPSSTRTPRMRACS